MPVEEVEGVVARLDLPQFLVAEEVLLALEVLQLLLADILVPIQAETAGWADPAREVQLIYSMLLDRSMEVAPAAPEFRAERKLGNGRHMDAPVAEVAVA